MRQHINREYIPYEIMAELPIITDSAFRDNLCKCCGYYAGVHEKVRHCMLSECIYNDCAERFAEPMRQVQPAFEAICICGSDEEFDIALEQLEILSTMFRDEAKEEKRQSDICFNCSYASCGPCIGICWRSLLGES